MKLTPATGTKETATFRPYNTFFGNEKRSVNINDFIDKRIKRRSLEVLKENQFLEMKKEEAIAMGAEAMFIDKYGETVTVFSASSALYNTITSLLPFL